MADLNLRVSDYQNAITALQGYYSQLSDILGQYQSAKGSVGDFYEGGEAEQLSADVQASIDKVNHAMEVTQKNIDNLQQVVDKYNETESTVQQQLEEAQQEIQALFS